MYNLKPSEIEEKVNEIADKVLKGNETPWVIFPSIKLTKEDFIKYKNQKLKKK